MDSIAKIYSVWDGNAESLAADIGQSGITVRQWRNRGSIPPAHWAAIITAAKAKGRTLVLDDFGPLPHEVEAVARAEQAIRDAA